MPRKSSYILWFPEIDKTDGALAGDYGVRLSEMAQAGFPVPNGFILSSFAYFTFIRENKLFDKIHNLLSTAHFERPDSLMQISAHIRKLIMHGSMPEEMVKDIFIAYRKLGGIFRDAEVKVYISPYEIASSREELPLSSMRGHGLEPLRRSRNDIICKGEANIILNIKEGWASLFEPKTIIKAHEKKIDYFRYGMAMVVQKMLKPDVSGIIYTIDPIANDKTKMVIEAVYGPADILIKGIVTPDRVEVRKTDLEVINKIIGNQKLMLKKTGSMLKEAQVPSHLAIRQKLTQNQIIDLAELGKRLERHYYFPQEIEWVIEKNKIYIVRTRAINTIHNKETEVGVKGKLQLILKGLPVSPGIVTGKVKIVTNEKEMEEVGKGDILVAGKLINGYKRAIKKAAAIITDHGGRASHLSIACLDFGIPAVAGTESATRTLRNGMIVTVNGVLGEVYKGGIGKQNHFKTATRIYEDVNANIHTQNIAQKNSDGVGLLRAEFLMTNLKAHPKKFFKDNKGEIYSGRLAEQIRFFCEAFADRPVVYRACDFKTSEYSRLVGGESIESIEKNPILGYRGAFRYINDVEVFMLELAAVKKVRQAMNHTNLWMMMPFCRTVKELLEVKKIMSHAGLNRSDNFKLWMTVDTPASVILLDKFIEEGIDGVSIDLGELTTLVLAVDPDNNQTASEYDERNPAVLWALEKTIKTCHKNGITCSVFGQSLSRYPDLLEKLVEWGVSSLTVATDVAESTRARIFNIERLLVEKKHHGKN